MRITPRPDTEYGASTLNGIVLDSCPSSLAVCGSDAYRSDHNQPIPSVQHVIRRARICSTARKSLWATRWVRIAKFFLYTSAHRASKYHEHHHGRLNSEFDPSRRSSVRISLLQTCRYLSKDWAGTKFPYLCADHWGAYNGMTTRLGSQSAQPDRGMHPHDVTCMNDQDRFWTRGRQSSIRGATVQIRRSSR